MNIIINEIATMKLTIILHGEKLMLKTSSMAFMSVRGIMK